MPELSPEDFELIVLGYFNGVIVLASSDRVRMADSRAVSAAREIREMALYRLRKPAGGPGGEEA